MEKKRKFTPLQEMAFQRLWSWNYLQRFPIALYAPLCALVEQLEDAPLESFLAILEALIGEREKRKTVFPSGGCNYPPNMEFKSLYSSEITPSNAPNPNTESKHQP